MRKQIVYGMFVITAVAGAQNFPRAAAIVGGGSPDGGKCTVEVVVDGAAEVEIRGANATLRNLSGQAPQWRRFECTSPMPANPGDFHFAGVDGRGRQELVRDPRSGGVAVVRIEDSDNGSEGYTFDLTWGRAAFPQDRGPISGRDDRGFDRDRDRPRDNDFYYRDRESWFRGDNWRSMFFQRIRQDLDHVTSGAFPFSGDRARLARTQMELDELQAKLARGFYDERELDEVIGAMQTVVSANRMSPRDRDMLTDDLSRLRDFRVRHDDFGARDIEGPYHRDRDERFRGDNWRAMFFQRIREDLDHVAASTSPFGRDQARLARTLMELDELQQKLSRGFYDERELDEATRALQVVVEPTAWRRATVIFSPTISCGCETSVSATTNSAPTREPLKPERGAFGP
jgi:hypothetical protein